MRGQSPASSGNSNSVDRLKLKVNLLADEIRRLKSRQTVSMGKWRLSEDPGTGDLVAFNSDTSSSVVLARRISSTEEES